MEKKIVIGLVGEICAGKGTVASHLKEKYNSQTYRFSDPLRDILQRLHIEIDRKPLQELSLCLRAQFGQDLLAKTISKDVEKNGHNIIVVDGIRRFEDTEYLKKLPEFKLVYITADINLRYQRILKRGENGDEINKTFEQFQKDNQGESELHIVEVGKTADYTLDNSGTVEELYNKIDEIINNQ